MSNRARLRAPGRYGSRLRIAESAAGAAVLDRPATGRSRRLVTIDEASARPALSATAGGGLRYRARLIEGDRWGSSGYYSRRVLERDGPTAWPAGTQMFYDHPTPEEEAGRPVRSVRDIAAVTTSTPVYEADNPKGPGLYADVEIFPHAAPVLGPMAGTVGLSVRGEASANWGTMAGRDGWIIEGISRGDSVDFVTRAGAGGALVSLLESARRAVTEAGTVGAWLESRLHLALTQLADDMYGSGRLTREERIALSGAIGDGLTAWTKAVQADAPQLFNRSLYDEPAAAGETTDVAEAMASDVERALTDLVADAYGAERTYVWVRDHDPDKRLVWFDVSTDSDCTTYQQPYQQGDGGVLTLSGDRVEVIGHTVYTPVPAGAPDEVVVEAAPPPTPPQPPAPATPAPANASQGQTAPPPTGGTPPTAPITPVKETGMSGTQNTGAPPAAGQVDGGAQATPVTEAAYTDLVARAELAEARLAEATTRQAALVESSAAQARVLAERDAAIAEAHRLRADATARTAVAQAVAEAANIPEPLRALIAPRVTAAIVGRVPLGEAGAVNTDALTTAIAAAIDAEATYAAALLEAQGAGRVAGLGSAAAVTELSEADFETQSAAFYRSIGMSEADALVAAKGR